MQHYGYEHFEAARASIDTLAPPTDSAGDLIERALRAARTHLNLQVAYLSEFVGDETIFRSVDAPGLEHLIKPGDSRSLDDVYCRHILAGRLPELIPDTADEPFAATLPITGEVPIGAHVSVPIRLGSGAVYGMFCCLGPAADPTLNERDLKVMRCFADMAAAEVDRRLAAEAKAASQRQRIAAIVAERRLSIHYQPIWDIETHQAIGFEALSRFDIAENRSPDHWFGEAQRVGLGAALEILAIELALEGLDRLPHGAYLTVNSSPSTAACAELCATLLHAPLDRLVLEITEHDRFADIAALVAAIAPLRRDGLRIAVDDAGAGYSGLQQILELQPDIIKLDRFFVRSIESDPTRRALATALADFARSVGCTIIGEGVESSAELVTLEEIGFQKVQGFLLGRPAPIEELRLDYPDAA